MGNCFNLAGIGGVVCGVVGLFVVQLLYAKYKKHQHEKLKQQFELIANDVQIK